MSLYKVLLQLSCRHLQALAAALRSPWSLLLSRLKSPSSPSLSSQQRGSSPRIIAGASSGPAPTAPALSCAEGSRAGRRTPAGSQQSGAEGQNPLPHPGSSPRCWGCSPGHCWPARLPAHIARTRPGFHSPVPASPSPQGCSQSILHPACICAWDCPDPNAGPRTWPC